MRIEKFSNKIVCDNIGCGRLAKYKATMKSGNTFFICEECLKEATQCLGELRDEGK